MNLSWIQLLLAIEVVAGVMVLSGCDDSDAAVRTQPKTPSPLHYLSTDGVGPINAATPFNLRLIGDAFQGLNVTEEMNFIEGERYSVITIKQRTRPLMSINPDQSHQKVFSIMVHDNLIGNRLQHPIGTAFSLIYPYQKVEECAVGKAELAGKVLCRAPNVGNVLYLFSGSWDGPKDELPPLKVLADWRVESFIWKPPLQSASVQPQTNP